MMKRALVLLYVLTNTANASETQEMYTTNTPVNISHIDQTRGGQIIIFVFSNKGFPKRHELADMKFILPVKSESMTFNIPLPKQSPFAIKALHDENLDGKVTKNWTGIIPKDGLGFSNNARISFTGPPKFIEAKLQYQPDMIIDIKLHYF